MYTIKKGVKKMSRKYKCQICKTEFEKDELLVFNGKNYCSTCYEIEKSRKELSRICSNGF